MTLQEQIVRMTQKALEDVVRAARAVPADRHEWSPGGEARPLLSQMQELATSGSWFLPIVRERQVPVFDEHARAEAARLRARFSTLEECIEGAREGTGELCRAILEVPDGVLDQEITLPFGGGMTLTMADVLAMHHWNLVYHLGQISQIQLILGDAEMH